MESCGKEYAGFVINRSMVTESIKYSVSTNCCCLTLGKTGKHYVNYNQSHLCLFRVRETLFFLC